MRQTGDIGLCPVITWERGVVDLAPSCIDHATVGAAREGRVGAVLMRDVSAAMVPSGDEPLPLDQHLRFLDHLATFHAVVLGLGRHHRAHPARQPLPVLRAPRARVRAGARRSRPRCPRSRPRAGNGSSRRARDGAHPRARCTPTRGRCSPRSPRRRARSSTATGSSATSAPPRRSHRARRLVDVRGRAAARRARALPRPQRGALPRRSDEGACDRGVPRRARAQRHRDRAVVRPAAPAVPARRDVAARLGEGLRRHRRRARLVVGTRARRDRRAREPGRISRAGRARRARRSGTSAGSWRSH